MKISYNWLQSYFKEKLPDPKEISEGIIFHAFEVEEIVDVNPPMITEGDTVFDIKVLPDRAHDCLSHLGIAKEVSAIFDLKMEDTNIKTFNDSKDDLEIEVKNEKCHRYMGRVIRNVHVGQSPKWLEDKLIAIGQKPINNIVDIANYVMFDKGQPIHAFDLDKLHSHKLIIRSANLGEKITTLDKKEINLDDSIMVIADEKDPLAIAGIKGGVKAEVDVNTKNILLEVANFDSVTIRKTSKKVNILTDAVKRYENEISPELCSLAMDEVSYLINKIAQGEVKNIVDIYPQKPDTKIVSVSTDYINRRLGSSFSEQEIESVWLRLKFKYVKKDDIFEIEIPSLRLDLIGPHDLTEEVIRILGYDRLEEKLPEITTNKKINDTFYKMILARNRLLEDGYSEVMTYAFCDKGKIEVLASASDKNFLRDNLTDGLKESIKLNTLNLPLLDIKEVKVFEIGTVFLKDEEEVRVAYGDKKAITEMTIDDFCNKFNLLSNNIVPIEDLIQGSQNVDTFKMWSLYPFISRDISVWVPKNIEPQKLVDIYKSFGTELLIKEPALFDSFEKDGRVSFAYRLIFQSYDRTLTDEEVNTIMLNITEKISSLGWEVR